tara:strand:+ start:746 stop:943 length:198 start_codon:yes stop_codon:yes gene_type:complete
MSVVDLVTLIISLFVLYWVIRGLIGFAKLYWTEILDEDERSFFRDPVAYTRKSAKDNKDESDGTG